VRTKGAGNSYDCAKCGACSAVCPVYQVTGRESFTARGRLHLLTKLTKPLTSRPLDEIFSKCLLCGACASICPRGIDITSITIKARQEIEVKPGLIHFKKWLSRQALAHPALLNLAGQTLSRIKKSTAFLPRDSGLRLRLTSLPDLDTGPNYITSQPPQATPPQVIYFTGCLANHLSPAIARSSSHLLNKLCGQNSYAPPGQVCCGLAAQSAGDMEQAMKLARQNIEVCDLPQWRNLPIITSCASCYAQLKDYPRLLANNADWSDRAKNFADRVRELSSYILENMADSDAFITSQSLPKQVVYHDPCHLRFGAGHDTLPKTPTPARQLINKVAGLKLIELPHGPQCCGQGGAFRIGYPDLSKQIGQKLWQDFAETKCELLTTTCTGCLLQWQEGLRQTNIPAQVVHLAILLDDYMA
jgi:glycolate oxidase iron-sulfur subunit